MAHPPTGVWCRRATLATLAAIVVVPSLCTVSSAWAADAAPAPLDSIRVTEPAAPADLVTGEVVVSVEPGAGAADLAELADAVGATDVAPVAGSDDLVVLSVPAGDEQRAAARLEHADAVAWSEPNAVVTADAAP